ncbi:MAG: lipopolysaccharide transport system permease protein [Chloroflexota bacterium]|jgi:ABC-type polysaccharide/polyol phosphate export permease|nr:lipopolysaccharide transport system permease protein [Chloroflexota bacterium]
MFARSEVPAAYRTSAEARGPLSLLREGIREVASRRLLIRYLVQADLKKSGADTLLGNLWWVIDPLLQMLVYVILVSVIFVNQTPDYPLFIFAGILPWKWFSTSIGDATLSVVAQAQLIRQVRFPKLVLPIATTTAGIANFGFGMIALAGLMLFYRDRITVYLLLIPLIAVVQYVFTLSLAIFVAGVNVFFRDLGNVVRHALRLWFYLSPGLYAIKKLEDSALFTGNHALKVIASANPFAILFEAYRSVIYGTDTGGPPTMPDWAALGALLLVSLVLVGVMTVIFKRLEPSFAKVL